MDHIAVPMGGAGCEYPDILFEVILCFSPAFCCSRSDVDFGPAPTFQSHYFVVFVDNDDSITEHESIK